MSEIAYEARLISEHITRRLTWLVAEQHRWLDSIKVAEFEGGIRELRDLREYIENVRLTAVQEAKMNARGYKDGRAAGTWFFNGPRDDETDAKILKGIEDGDPEVLDILPEPHLSGEWADDPTWEDICREEFGDDYKVDFAEDTGMLNQYHFGFQQGVQDEIVQTIKGYSVKEG